MVPIKNSSNMLNSDKAEENDVFMTEWYDIENWLKEIRKDPFFRLLHMSYVKSQRDDA